MTAAVLGALGLAHTLGLGLGLALTLGLALADGLGAGVTGEAAAQVGVVNTLVSIDTCPLRARVRPSTTAPVVTEMEVSAMTVPVKRDPVPSAAELPTCQ